jgi:hypothetical protein
VVFFVGLKAAAKPDTSVVRPRGGCKLGCVKTALERVISLITIESSGFGTCQQTAEGRCGSNHSTEQGEKAAAQALYVERFERHATSVIGSR